MSAHRHLTFEHLGRGGKIAVVGLKCLLKGKAEVVRDITVAKCLASWNVSRVNHIQGTCDRMMPTHL